MKRGTEMRRVLIFLVAIVLVGAGFAGAAQQEPLPRVRARIKDGAWKEYPTRTLAALTGFKPNPATVPVDKFGGWTAQTEAATGYFYPKKIGDRWWLITPEGHPYLHVGVVSVRILRTPREREQATKKFGSPEKWAEATSTILTENGFTGTGAWSDDTLLAKSSHRPAYTVMWNFMSAYGKKRGGTFAQPGHTGYPNDSIFAFDPEFETFCDEHAKQLAATKDDPYLLGHFSDNELPFPKDSLDKFLALPESDAGGKAARQWVQARKGSATAALDAADREAWRGYVAERYFSVVSRAIKKYDPNHLYLGSRFYGNEKGSEPVFQAAGRYLDVIAVNVYGSWNPRESVARWANWAGKPVLVTEWYAKGDDSGMKNTTGAGWTVATQAERGMFYQHFTLQLLESRACVGWHWFRYRDNDPEEAGDASNQDSNKGIVRLDFRPYTPLLTAMRDINTQVYPLTTFFDAPTAVSKQAGP